MSSTLFAELAQRVVKVNTIFPLYIGTPKLLTILVINFEHVHFTSPIYVSKVLLDEWQTV